jgi:hypothetical protein
MERLLFFKQVSNDGGVQWGIQVDDDAVWMHYDAGSGVDPGLLWYVVVEFTGELPNGNADVVRALFCKYAETAKEVLTEVIEALRVERGLLVWPESSREFDVEPRLKLRAKCSAIRRIYGMDLVKPLVQLRDNWNEHLDKLELHEEKPPPRRRRKPTRQP